ncbi:hypothetical protein FS842_005639 [Serendipita sp. 407]|nr:hypothetical protein FS842_005639 [Serendipita sp. 407]
MRVCRQWKFAVLHTGRLWSKIRLGGQESSPSQQRRVDDYELCHTPHRLKKILTFAADAPLDLVLAFPRIESSKELIDTLRTSNACFQIRSLLIEDDWIQNHNLDGFEFPALEHAVLYYSSPSLNMQIMKSAYRLRYFDLAQVEKSEHGLDFTNVLSPLELNLRLQNCMHADFSVRQTICSIPHLIRLSLYALAVPDTGTLTFPTLQSLSLHNVRLGCNLACPSLKELCLFHSSIPTKRDHPLILPSLACLKLEDISDADCAHIRAGSIDTLYLSHFQYDTRRSELMLETLLEEAIKPGYLHSKRLHLYAVSIDTHLLIDILRQMNVLVEIHVTGYVQLTKPFFEALAGCSLPVKSALSHAAPICPYLQVFALALRGTTLQTRPYVASWFKEAIEIRGKEGYPLKEASLQESERGAWVHLL